MGRRVCIRASRIRAACDARMVATIFVLELPCSSEGKWTPSMVRRTPTMYNVSVWTDRGKDLNTLIRNI